MKILTKNWKTEGSLNLTDYLKTGGYDSLKKALAKIKRMKVLAEVKKSNLLGRGGAGFSVGSKWEIVAEKISRKKYFICNLDESEPGNFKDKSLAEKNPHQIIEGIIIGAYTVGANQAFIYLNGTFKEAGEQLQQAIEDCYRDNLLGKNILGSDFDLDLEIFYGAGAYICGEESALINSIEGKRGEPRKKPPYPCDFGLFGKPTVVNNAETLANISWIIENGGDKFSKIGKPDSPGTKLFSIDGAVNKPGLYEAPMNKTIEQLIQLAGGIRKDLELNFVQVGGSSGRIVPRNFLLEIPSYSRKAEIPVGSGSVLVFSKKDDIKKVLLSWINFFQRESCGKCVPCREGTFRLKQILERLENGNFDNNDKQDLIKLIWTLDNTTFCPLGKFSVVALKDVIKYRMVREFN
jgi:NADH-quinone oxidoreductase subunit F